MDTMNVKVNDLTFDQGHHDADGDVLQSSTATMRGTLNPSTRVYAYHIHWMSAGAGRMTTTG